MFSPRLVLPSVASLTSVLVSFIFLQNLFLTHHQKDSGLVEVCAFSVSSELPRRDGAMARRKPKGSGFGSEQQQRQGKQKRKHDNDENNTIYSKPSLYDLAFGYRNYEDEISFLLEAHRSTSGSLPQTILELAAGPGRHSLTALTWSGSPSISHATALDMSPHMRAYSLDLAHQSISVNVNSAVTDRLPFVILNDEVDDITTKSDDHFGDSTFQYVLGDMKNFKLSRKFDSAWLLLGSMQHLLSNKDVMQCFRSVYEALTTNGTIIIELQHPQETFTMLECTRSTWKVPLDFNYRTADTLGDDESPPSSTSEAYLKVLWGEEDDPFDPISQVRNLTVVLELVNPHDPATSTRISEVVPTRVFTAQEIDALAACCGFEVTAMYGALDKDIPITDPEVAYRMVCVLRKIS